MPIARLALDVPVPQLFDYVAPGLTQADIGKLAVVPFGRRRQVGLIMELAQHSELPAKKLKPLEAVVQAGPRLPASELALLRFCSEYYHHPLGQVAFTALPPALRRVRKTPLASPEHVRLTDAGADLKAEQFSPRQLGARRLLAHLHTHAGVTPAEFAALGAAARRALKQFRAQGWVAPHNEAHEDPAPRAAATAAPPERFTLTAEQARAFEAIAATLDGFSVCLLHGITGSGKTEVYLRAIGEVVRAGKQALVLLPEINLTPRTEALFRARFPAARIVCLHSNVSELERAKHFLAAQRGHSDIVIGTRSSVFTPLPRLGLIVVDEEHDASYKQNDGLRYHARDLAVYRGKQRDVPVVLGSATPSLESYAHARAGRYLLQQIGARAHPRAQLPAARLISMRKQRGGGGVSGEVLDALRLRVQRGEQALVFINRRGFAPVLYCAACGWISQCTRCSARMVLHTRDQRLHCHYCGRIADTPPACPDCGGDELLPLGRGTQRVEALLHEALPEARLMRVDRDSMARKDAWAQALAKIDRHEVDILVGTQMLAKGHDFERLTLVALVEVDQALYSADFRAAERLFALMVQVAGRAGRAQLPGEVLIQTLFPEHPLLRAALEHDYVSFARSELAAREAAGFPPFVHQALLRAEALDAAALRRFMQAAAAAGRQTQPRVTVYDPLAPAIERVAGKSRLQLLVQSASRQRLQKFLGNWNEQLAARNERRVRWAIDVDPSEL